MFKNKTLVYDNQINGYKEVHDEKGGIVLLGGETAENILTDKFAGFYDIDMEVSNCSRSGMTLTEAAEVFDSFAAEKMPERLILHLGEADVESFEKNEREFDRAYLELIESIRKTIRTCSVCLVTLRNEENSAVIEKMNRHIRNIADAENCAVVDLNSIRDNDAEVCKTVAFVYELGFMGNLNKSISDRTLVKMLYSADLAAQTESVEETENEKKFIPDPVFRVMGALA